ncbi:MAG: HlyD family secretion protein [Anaerolineae bacterium]
MKRKVGLVILILLASAIAGGWGWMQAAPEQVVRFLTGAGIPSAQAQEFVARWGGEAARQPAEVWIASGTIEGDEVAIVSEFGGQVIRLYVQEGDEVVEGQVLVELDPSLLLAQKAQAEAAVAAAQANLREVQSGAHPGQILAARAALAQAQAERDAAKLAWEDAMALLNDPQEIEAQIVQAQAAVELAAVQIEQAQARLKAAEVDRDKYRAQGTMEEKWLYRIYQYQVQAAQVEVEAARANKEGAEKTLKALQTLRHNPLALISQVHLAEGRYQVAEAGLAVAQAKLTELETGPTAEAIAVAQAQVDQAQALVDELNVQIAKLTLRSPISGVVTSRSIRTGETAMAGTPLLTVANLDEVQLTVYVPENELGRVYLGQQVQVQVDSFPDRVFIGTVAYISQQAEFTPKNVQTEEGRVNMVFAVRIHLPNLEHQLKLGMPADAILDG